MVNTRLKSALPIDLPPYRGGEDNRSEMEVKHVLQKNDRVPNHAQNMDMHGSSREDGGGRGDAMGACEPSSWTVSDRRDA
jgi:hypothetical protein